MRALRLPPTIRTPEPEDVPQEKSTLDLIESRRSANIVEGYTLTDSTSQEHLFNFYCEINVDNDKLWSIVKELVIQFNDDVALIYQHIDDDDAKYGDYVNKFQLLNHLSGFETELVQDGYFHFGIISHTKESLQEVFVHRTKYIQYWGIEKDKFERIMHKHDIYIVNKLQFIDEFPVQTTVLNALNPAVTNTDDLLKLFELKYGNEQFLD